MIFLLFGGYFRDSLSGTAFGLYESCWDFY